MHALPYQLYFLRKSLLDSFSMALLHCLRNISPNATIFHCIAIFFYLFIAIEKAIFLQHQPILRESRPREERLFADCVQET